MKLNNQNKSSRQQIKKFAIVFLSLVLVLLLALLVKELIAPAEGDKKADASDKAKYPSGSATSSGKSEYSQRFMELFDDIQKKGYLSPDGVPYHSIETLMVEAPDYGHLSTSEAFSFMTWLNATYGRMTGDWSYFKDAWDKTEKYIIPDPVKDQPGANTYQNSKPATFATEEDTPQDYPNQGVDGAPTGVDPISDDLAASYGSKAIYQMHWLLDTDNWYKYGNHADGVSKNSYINTYQRGAQESVWETVPHPSWEEFKWGAQNGGFLQIFGKFGQPSKQWRYTSASDADARQVQASYWAYLWSKEQGKDSEIAPYLDKAAKMGDYLRYTMFDKYFRPIGTQNNGKAGTGYDSCHYLLSWYTSWGGDTGGSWSWRIGSSHSHQGYQNVVAAQALANEPALKPKSQQGQTDWTKSLERQLELYQYLQSSEGAIAGGVTNSWEGKYSKYPEGSSTFYDMIYDWQPVYHDPPSNNWFGFQAWSMERVMEYYYITGDEKAKALCDKWAKWAMSETKLESDGTYKIPSDLEWSGQPDSWKGAPTDNSNLHCKVTSWTVDVGVTAAYAKALIYYAAAYEKHSKTVKEEAKNMAKELLDRMWKNYRDDKGIAVSEKRADYKRFNDEVYIPKDFNGKNGQGAEIKNGMTFLDMRPDYKKDPDFPKVEEAIKNGTAPEMKYHRFWAQADIAMANAMYHIYFCGGGQFNPENDYSFKGLSKGSTIKTEKMPVYDGAVKVGGLEPGEIPKSKDNSVRNSSNQQEDTSASNNSNQNNNNQNNNAPNYNQSSSSKGNSSNVGNSGALDLQFFNSVPAAKTNTIASKFKLTNTGSSSVKLSDVKFRYYLTSDDGKKQIFWCDWSTVGNDAVTGKFLKTNGSKNKADCYAEIGFTSKAGNLDPGRSIEVQTRFTKEGWTEYEQTGDYSYNSSANNYTDWNRVTLYMNGKLISGIEP
ncbi:MAG: glycoside hydrolase family 48 protein [Bacillota bacterium]|nr:glycoside hydrolase family 48 protein [Bacillota bacterium]